MKEVQRRVGKKKARANAEKMIRATALRLLQKRWRSVYPRLEKLKSVQKGDGDPEWDDAGEWASWSDEFESSMDAAFADAAAGMISNETAYWTDKGKGVVFDTEQFIRDFKSHIGVRSPEHSIKNIGASTLQQTQDKIEAWYANPDADWQDLASSLSSLYGESRAQAIAVTETTALSAEVMRNTMKQVGVTKWDSIPLYEHTCEDCIDKSDANPHELGEEEPPYHVNCILPGNKVEIPDLVAATKSFYVGECIEIFTASGKNITLTSNHPILTSQGWVRANKINIGNDLIKSIDSKRICTLINPHYKDRPANIEEIFESLMKRFSVFAKRVKISPKDFNGDGRCIDGDIEIIDVNSLLSDKRYARLYKKIGDDNFTFGNVDRLLFHSNSVFDISFNGTRFAFDRFMCMISNLMSIIGISKLVTHKRRLFEAPSSNTVFNEDPLDSASVDSINISKFKLRFSEQITSDKVVRIRKFDFRGHVYDLQEKRYGLYFCNDIVTHNCNCEMSFTEDTLEEPEDVEYK